MTDVKQTAAAIDRSTERLAALVRAKHDVLEQILALAETQKTVIAEEDMDRLLSILAAKQPLMSELGRLERALDPFRQEDPESRQWRTPADRRACQKWAERAAAMLATLMAIETECDALLRGRRDATARQLTAVGDAIAARRAYAVVGAAQRGLDLSSET
jgi:hypothetical protein